MYVDDPSIDEFSLMLSAPNGAPSIDACISLSTFSTDDWTPVSFTSAQHCTVWLRCS